MNEGYEKMTVDGVSDELWQMSLWAASCLHQEMVQLEKKHVWMRLRPIKNMKINT